MVEQNLLRVSTSMAGGAVCVLACVLISILSIEIQKSIPARSPTTVRTEAAHSRQTSYHYSDDVAAALVMLVPVPPGLEIELFRPPFDGIRLVEWLEHEGHAKVFGISVDFQAPGIQLYCHFWSRSGADDADESRKWWSYDDGMVGLPVRGLPFSEPGWERMKRLAERIDSITKDIPIDLLGQGLPRKLPADVYVDLREALETPGGCN